MGIEVRSDVKPNSKTTSYDQFRKIWLWVAVWLKLLYIQPFTGVQLFIVRRSRDFGYRKRFRGWGSVALWNSLHFLRRPPLIHARNPTPLTALAREVQTFVLALQSLLAQLLGFTPCLWLRQCSQRCFPPRPWGLGPVNGIGLRRRRVLGFTTEIVFPGPSILAWYEFDDNEFDAEVSFDWVTPKSSSGVVTPVKISHIKSAWSDVWLSG